MIRDDVRAMALALLAKACEARKELPRSDIVGAMMALVKRKGADVAPDIVLIPSDEMVRDKTNRVRNVMRGLVQQFDPEVVIFWSESYVRTTTDMNDHRLPSECDDREDCIMMEVQDRDQTLVFLQRFHWVDDACVFAPLDTKDEAKWGLFGGRLIDWFKPTKH